MEIEEEEEGEQEEERGEKERRGRMKKLEQQKHKTEAINRLAPGVFFLFKTRLTHCFNQLFPLGIKGKNKLRRLRSSGI